MEKSIKVKESIVKAATELIQLSGGNPTKVTTRAIAERAGVGGGLINYHFQSKENLITICVQSIIQTVIQGFSTDGREYSNPVERLTDAAAYVFEFLFQNPAISRISILGDLHNYAADCNSVYTQRGFITLMPADMEQGEAAFLAFVLTAAMQTAFLSGSAVKEIIGYDFETTSGRSEYIKKIVNLLLRERGRI